MDLQRSRRLLSERTDEQKTETDWELRALWDALPWGSTANPASRLKYSIRTTLAIVSTRPNHCMCEECQPDLYWPTDK